MSEKRPQKQAKNDSKASALKVLQDLVEVAKILAKGVGDLHNPGVSLAALVVVVLIIAVVVAAILLKEALILFGLLAFVLLFMLCIPNIVRTGTERKLESLGRTEGGQEITAGAGSGVNQAKLDRLQRYLDGMCRSAAQLSTVGKEFLRSNIFVPTGSGTLKIPRGLHHNMMKADELTIEIPEGYGASGHAFQQRTAVIARAKGGWGQYVLSPKEMVKLHPDLKWIVSLPIPDSTGNVLGVANVDCLEHDRSAEELRPLISEMGYWVNLVAPELATA